MLFLIGVNVIIFQNSGRADVPVEAEKFIFIANQ